MSDLPPRNAPRAQQDAAREAIRNAHEATQRMADWMAGMPMPLAESHSERYTYAPRTTMPRATWREAATSDDAATGEGVPGEGELGGRSVRR